MTDTLATVANETPPLYTAPFIAIALDVRTSEVTKACKARHLREYGTVCLNGEPVHVFTPYDIWKFHFDHQVRKGGKTMPMTEMEPLLAKAEIRMRQDGTLPPAQVWLLVEQNCADLHWLSNYAHHGGATDSND